MIPHFIRNLVPRKDKQATARPLGDVLVSLTWVQWAHFLSGLLAWTCDTIDYYSVSLSIPALQVQFNRPVQEITTALTLTCYSDRLGDSLWDAVGSLWAEMASGVQPRTRYHPRLGVGFVQTFKQFLALRSLFGIGMGGVWGLASSTALENLPVEARGIASGVLQQGFAIGCILAAVVNLTLVPETPAGWRSLFWTAAGMSLFAAFVRAVLPESEVFIRARAAEKARGTDAQRRTQVFLKETKNMIKRHWILCIYSVVLSTGFNFLGHGSQDLYPTYLQVSKNFSAHSSTLAVIIQNCGAFIGGTIAGYISQYIGRRLTIILCVLLVGVFVPLWIIPTSFGALMAGAFFIQFGVQGAWSVMPIYLAEISHRLPGHLPWMASSAASQIEASERCFTITTFFPLQPSAGGDHLRTTIIKAGVVTNIPDYATVQGILIGAVAAFVIITTIIGPENHGSHFEKHKTAFEEGVARDDALTEDDLIKTPRDKDGESNRSAVAKELQINLRKLIVGRSNLMLLAFYLPDG
ncbi:major facilitator superfamily domain-containing protein [Infundibulicybe gibba]|nr:major facilitator superfamily domain-containing protein [Infundibulicybe gibba]